MPDHYTRALFVMAFFTPALAAVIYGATRYFYLKYLKSQRTWKSREHYITTGKTMRPVRDLGECPGCGVGGDEWCKNDCTYLDPYDYR